MLKLQKILSMNQIRNNRTHRMQTVLKTFPALVFNLICNNSYIINYQKEVEIITT